MWLKRKGTQNKVKVVLRVDTNDSNGKKKKRENNTDQRWKENMVLHLIVPSPLGLGSEQHSRKS